MLVALLVIAVLGLAYYAFWVEPRSLSIRRLTVATKAWPRAAPPLRIAVLADLHASFPHLGPERLHAIVDQVQAEAPDLVVVLGDVVTTHTLGVLRITPEAVADVLARLSAPLGVAAVLGNHDWDYDGPRVRRALTAAGIAVLEDEVLHLEADDHRLALGGLRELSRAEPDLERVVMAAEGAPLVLLSHSPDVFPEVPAQVALTLAGHTHGGQVNLPWLGTPVTCSRYGRRYVHGHIVEDGRHLVVSAGIGHSALPVRFRVPPEIVVVTLTAGA